MSKPKWYQEVVAKEVATELTRATEIYGPIVSAHEGYAIILEELDELKAEIWKKNKDPYKMQEEAIQIAAMAMRFVIDICFENRVANMNANDL
jgi:hypothetical protein